MECRRLGPRGSGRRSSALFTWSRRPRPAKPMSSGWTASALNISTTRWCRPRRPRSTSSAASASLPAAAVGRPGRLPAGGLPRRVRRQAGCCYRSLEGAVPLAPFADGADPEAVRALAGRFGFPLIRQAPPRPGRRVCSTRRGMRGRVRRRSRRRPTPVVQTFLDDSSGEYTVGMLCGRRTGHRDRVPPPGWAARDPRGSRRPWTTPK